MNAELYKRLTEAAEYAQELPPTDLQEGLDSDDPYVVWIATKAAGSHRMKSAVPALFALARRPGWPRDVDVASIAAWSLARIGGDDVFACACKLSISGDESDRRFAADLLGELQHPDGIPQLEKLLSDESEQVALWAALSLSKFGSAGILPLGRVGEKAQTGERTIVIVDALFKIATPPAIDRAIQLLNDSKHIPAKDAASLMEALSHRAPQ